MSRLRLSIFTVSLFCLTLTKKSQEKGLNYFSQGYIHAIKDHSRDNLSDIDAKCWRSMSKNQSPHTLHFSIDINSEKIVDNYCSCKAGLGGRCSRIIGLVKTLQGLKLYNFSHVPEQQSCTSLPQQWQIPRGNKISGIPINQVVVARPQTQSRKKKPILCQIDCDTRLPHLREDDIRVLQELEGTPLQYMLQTDAPTVPTPPGDVQLGSPLSY